MGYHGVSGDRFVKDVQPTHMVNLLKKVDFSLQSHPVLRFERRFRSITESVAGIPDPSHLRLASDAKLRDVDEHWVPAEGLVPTGRG